MNLALAAPKIDHILIPPGRDLFFWRLVGDPSAKKRLQGRADHLGQGDIAGHRRGECASSPICSTGCSFIRP